MNIEFDAKSGSFFYDIIETPIYQPIILYFNLEIYDFHQKIHCKEVNTDNQNNPLFLSNGSSSGSLPLKLTYCMDASIMPFLARIFFLYESAVALSNIPFSLKASNASLSNTAAQV